jgi:GNAT superfamily N-acetyltransferase
MSNLRVTRLHDEQIAELIRCKARVYDREPDEHPDRYRWKFFQNPHRGKEVPFWLLWDGDRMLGGIGALPVRMLLFGTEIAGEFACEMFIEKGQQRSGLGTVLMDAYIADSPLPLMMNTSQSLHRFLVKRGFHDLSVGLHFWVRPIRPGAMLAARWSGIKARAALLSGPLLRAAVEVRAATLRPPSDPSVRVEEVGGFGGWAEDLWAAAGAAYPVIVIRDLAYLRWKYERHYVHKYRILRAVDGKGTRGYLVHRLRPEARGPLMVVQELFTRHDDQGARLALLQHALKEARRADAFAIKLMTSTRSYGADLRRLGFFATRSSPGLLYPEQPGFDRPDLRDISNWFLSSGDSDLDYA